MPEKFEYTKRIFVLSKRVRGYLIFYDPKHPLAYNSGWLYLHRHLASKKLGRWLLSADVVHHINEDRTDNRLENLEVITVAEHVRVHRTGCKEFSYRVFCEICGKPTNNKKYCSVNCSNLGSRKVERLSREALEQEMKDNSWCALGRKYGVSDNAVRKWARKYGLL